MIQPEQTPKRFKAIQLVGFLGMLCGVSSCVADVVSVAPGHQGGKWAALGVLWFIGGLIVFLIGRFAAWWFHG